MTGRVLVDTSVWVDHFRQRNAPLVGPFRIANLYWALYRRLGAQVVYRMALINGEPGLLRYVNGRIESAQALVTDGERIVAIYAVRNPDKLAGVPATL